MPKYRGEIPDLPSQKKSKEQFKGGIVAKEDSKDLLSFIMSDDGIPASVLEPLDIVHDEETEDFQKGSKRAWERLDELLFDPIQKIVYTYHKLTKELQFQELWRLGKVSPLDSKGEPRWYSQKYHYELYDKIIAIEDKLLRYRYGRVPEAIEIKRQERSGLTVNLFQDNDTFMVHQDALEEAIINGDS